MTDGGSREPVPGCSDGAGGGFSALFERFWDSAIADGVTERQVTSIEEHLCLLSGARIVVAPSGCGRLALALAARGYAVRGVDRCTDAVDRSAALAAQAKLNVEFRCSDDWACGDADCDGGIAVGPGLALDELVAALTAALKPGARILIELDRNQTPEAMSILLARAGLVPIGPRVEWIDDGCVAAARSLLICTRSGSRDPDTIDTQ